MDIQVVVELEDALKQNIAQWVIYSLCSNQMTACVSFAEVKTNSCPLISVCQEYNNLSCRLIFAPSASSCYISQPVHVCTPIGRSADLQTDCVAVSTPTGGPDVSHSIYSPETLTSSRGWTGHFTG